MEKDRHYAEFSLLRSRNAVVGVCRPTVPTFVAAADTREGWGYHPLDGDAKHDGLWLSVRRPTSGVLAAKPDRLSCCAGDGRCGGDTTGKQDACVGG